MPNHYKELINIDLRDKVKSKNKMQLEDSSGKNFFNEWSNQDIKKFIDKYNQGISLREIGKYFGISTASVRNYILKDAGHDINFRGQGGGQKSEFLNDRRKVMKFIKLYQDEYTLKEIGEAFDISLPTVRNYINALKDQGMQLKSDQIREAKGCE